MKSGWNKLWVGLVAGMITPLLVLLGYWYVNFSFLRLDSFLFKELMANVLTPLISLCVVGNLGVFYLFLQKEFYYSSRGVVFATLIYAVVIFAVKLLA